MRIHFGFNQISRRRYRITGRSTSGSATRPVIALPYYDKNRAYMTLSEYRSLYKKL